MMQKFRMRAGSVAAGSRGFRARGDMTGHSLIDAFVPPTRARQDLDMRMSATIRTGSDSHRAEIATGDAAARAVAIPPRDGSPGSSASGGELLMLALATCYGNDVYREAAKRGVPVEAVEVTAEAEFPAAGAPASAVRYAVRVTSSAPDDVVRELLTHTDAVAEIQATVRTAIPVELASIEVVAR
jgi:organic hydroperoxide reductase OsmC/OhrA